MAKVIPSTAGESENLKKAISMNASAISKPPGSSGPDRVVTGFQQATAQALLIGLLVILAVGCSGGGQRDGQTPEPESTQPGSTAVAEAQTPTAIPPQRDSSVEKGQAPEATSTQPDATPVRDDQSPTTVPTQSETPVSGAAQVPEVTFPQHEAPLGTDNGGNYHAGRLILHEGCLRVEVPPDANGPGRASLLIWPSGFRFDVEDGAVRIVDSDGEIAASVGDHIRLTHAKVSYQEATDQSLLREIPVDCDGPFYLVGDEITVFDPNNEPTELRLADPDVLFPRKRTVIATGRSQKVAEGVGELVLEGGCLRLGRGDEHGDTIIWPAGFTPHVEQGVVQVRNGAGRVVAQVGDRIAGGGGYSNSGYGDCPGGTFGIHSIKVLPDVEVYFPQQDGTLGTGQQMERFVGKLVVERRCLMVDAPVRVRDRVVMPGGRYLLIWPDTFALDLDDEVAGVVDETGRVVARVGEEIEFSAVAVTYEEAMEHTGLRDVSPACSGGYWVVGEDFAAAGDGESR